LNQGLIGEITAAIIDYRGKTPPKSASGIKLLTAKVIKDGGVDETRLEYVSEDTYASWMRRGFPRQWDILLTTEAPLGEIALLRSPERIALAQRVILLRGNPAVVNQLYLFAALRSPLVQGRLRQRATGTTVVGIKQRELRMVEIPLPPLATQRKIAGILSAYDDLIENNTRRILLLEEMAQRIYREWFVDFRYPGHENVEMVASELGPIPEGWTTGRVSDHVDVIRGRSYRGTDVVDTGGVPFINLGCVAREGGFRPDGIKRYIGEFKEAHKVTAGNIVMAVTDMTQERRIVARAARVPELGEGFGVFSMDLVKIDPKDLPGEYVLGLLRYSDFANKVKAHANGANVLHLHPDRIGDYATVFPWPEIARRYAKQVAPTQMLSDGLQATNERLRATRDLLLPCLVSGVIDVTDLDIVITEPAA